jgi:DNA-binding NtrC family response regulator
MHIAIVTPDYHIVRVIEMLLQRKQYSVTCFGKLAQLERSQQHFDLLIVDPGKPAACIETLAHLATLRPEVRRILVTGAYENIAHARRLELPILFWPCSRQLFLTLIEDQAKLAPQVEVVEHGS